MREVKTFCIPFEIAHKAIDAVKVVAHASECQIAGDAKQAAHLSCGMAMVHMKMVYLLCANRASTILRFDHRCILIWSHSIALAQVIRAHLKFGASLVGIVTKTLSLLRCSALIALSAPAVFVSRANAKELDREFASACAACFNKGSHLSFSKNVIGQRPAGVDSAVLASSFYRVCSWQ